MAMPTAYEFDVDDLVMSSAAYYLGRQTISVTDFCRRLCLSWSQLSLPVQQYVQRIVESACEREALGGACDREAWLQVRALWLPKEVKPNPEFQVKLLEILRQCGATESSEPGIWNLPRERGEEASQQVAAIIREFASTNKKTHPAG